jgi:hypothetical protein
VHVNLVINLSALPPLLVVPGTPVTYAPSVPGNYFFYVSPRYVYRFAHRRLIDRFDDDTTQGGPPHWRWPARPSRFVSKSTGAPLEAARIPHRDVVFVELLGRLHEAGLSASAEQNQLTLERPRLPGWLASVQLQNVRIG